MGKWLPKFCACLNRCGEQIAWVRNPAPGWENHRDVKFGHPPRPVFVQNQARRIHASQLEALATVDAYTGGFTPEARAILDPKTPVDVRARLIGQSLSRQRKGKVTA
ncbi:MAG TPA: hypothetical protein VD929_04360 [Caulobacteraceae bacterium]|nr:hypothetical protein [Caulobacteraceae bacterium]